MLREAWGFRGRRVPGRWRLPSRPSFSRAVFEYIVAFKTTEGHIRFQIMWGALMGLLCVVRVFCCHPLLHVAMCRRWLSLITDMYFDDQCVVDLAAAKGTPLQRHCGNFRRQTLRGLQRQRTLRS